MSDPTGKYEGHCEVGRIWSRIGGQMTGRMGVTRADDYVQFTDQVVAALLVDGRVIPIRDGVSYRLLDHNEELGMWNAERVS